MSLIDHPWVLFVVLLVGLLVVVEVAYRLALRVSANDDEEQHHQIVAARDGIAVLLSLLLGFTLPMAEPHYELRKHLVVEEANAIGTTALRSRSLPEPVRGKNSRTPPPIPRSAHRLRRSRLAAAATPVFPRPCQATPRRNLAAEPGGCSAEPHSLLHPYSYSR